MLVGYQTNFTQLKLGMLFFNHQSCSTTLALEVEQFTDLYGGPVFNVARTGTEQCLGHCSSCEDLTPCTVECACAWVRALIDKLWGKDISFTGRVVRP